MKDKNCWGTFSALPGRKGKIYNCFFSQIARCKKAVDSGLAASTTTSKGAITIYKCDDGQYRAELNSFLITKDEITAPDFYEILKRAKEWVAKIRE